MSAKRILIGFRAVHPDFRSSRGYVWPFPGGVAKASGPFTDTPNKGCPSRVGDGICLANTAEGMASGRIPAITVLVCAYRPSDLLGTEPGGSKVRVREAKVLRVVDFPATLRGELPPDPDLPTKANLARADLYGANLYGANLSRANLYGANLYGADLAGANLAGANLYGANLARANLYGANLYGADMAGANLARANPSSTTILPVGYRLNGTTIERAS